MKFIIKILIIAALLIAQNTICAQEINQKLGKVRKEELEMAFYEKDSTAGALVIFDKGQTKFEYNNNEKQFQVRFERQMRVKIFKKEAYGNADFSIPLYQSGLKKEAFLNLKIVTYNLVDEKIEKTKASGKDFIIEETSKNHVAVKFTAPGVKEGSVFEISYSILSDFIFNLQNWRMQFEISVMYSEYNALIPEFFKYNIHFKGFDNVPIQTSKNFLEENFTVEYKSTPQVGGHVETGSYNLPSHSSNTTWTARNIPAFVEEPYLTSASDYLTGIYFELSSVQMPRSEIVNYSQSWQAVDALLMKDENFGNLLKSTDFFEEKTKEICRLAKTDKEKAVKIYEYVSKYIIWDKSNSLLSSATNLKRIYEKEEGNSADINLMLISMLKSAGINASPLILSTRKNGKLRPEHATISQFNYVVAAVKIDEKMYLLDATENYPFGILPVRCLNGKARIYNIANLGQDIDLEPAVNYETTSIYSLKINLDNTIDGTVNTVYKNYAAIDFRSKIGENGDVNDFFIEKNKKSVQTQYLNPEAENLKDIYENLVLKTEIKITDPLTQAGDIIYFTPLLNQKIENPFKLTERKYPVDFGFPMSETLIFYYQIPEGYSAIEVPQNVSWNLPEKAGAYKFMIAVSGNNIQIMSKFEINETVLFGEKYAILKNFYDMIVTKQAEKIVLKKNS